MYRVRKVLKKAFTPITIMLIPHTSRKSFSIKVPSVGVLASVILWFIGTVYVFSVAIDAFEYQRMKDKLNYYSSQFMEIKTTIAGLKKAEGDFQKLFSLKSREKVLEHIDTSDTGSIDMEQLMQQIKISMSTVGEIKEYMSQQRDLYISTPKGWPVEGRITSGFGKREHPRSGEPQFHSGIDIASDPGRPVRATADGIVSFAEWSGGSGNLVALEHGFGFSTYYAHNKMLNVKIGQKVKRGDIIGYIGSTGNSTGPHVHYEVWREGKPMNPLTYIEGRKS
ncbi:MAG: M23 family metallopeptidase [Nitrospirota bacterium]|nr:M23 family metallopeptidase [Nitrospirota bacterium]